MKKLSAILIALFAFVAVAAAQQVPVNDDNDVVKISTQVVQVDAVVTDKDGNPATELKAGDFEVLQDGKPREILSVTYVDLKDPKSRPAVKKLAKGKNVPATPGATVAPENAGRILTFVVDDGNCYVSRIGIKATREALTKFFGEQMQPNDLVAIYQTRGGSSTLQQYTSDRSQLMAVVNKIRWYPPSGVCPNDGTGDVFDAVKQNPTASLYSNNRIDAKDPIPNTVRPDAQTGNEASAQRNKNKQNSTKVEGLVGVLSFVTRGLQRVSGRKTVFLLSDGLRLQEANDKGRLTTGDQWPQMRDLIDMANRASIVFNTIDVRGVINPAFYSAGDDFTSPSGGTLSFGSTNKASSDRSNDIIISRSGLNFLADETGGRFYHDQNDLDVPIQNVLGREKGYYLIAYDPGEEAFKGRKFNEIKINIKPSGYDVRARSGFLSITDESLKPQFKTENGELYEALISPLPDSGLNLRLTAFFNNLNGKNSVRSIVYVNGDELKFTADGRDNSKAVFDVVAVTFDPKNKIVDEFNNTYTIKIPTAYVDQVKRSGLSFMADVPVKKPGNYNFRIAMRDTNTKLIGSAGRDVQVPDLKDKDLFISGLTVTSADDKGRFIFVPGAEINAGFTLVANPSDPSIRKFSPGEVLAYSYNIFNAANDPSAKAGVTAQVMIYRNGEVYVEGKPEPLKIDSAAGSDGQKDLGYMSLSDKADVGDYALQITLRNTAGKLLASEWIDYQIVN